MLAITCFIYFINSGLTNYEFSKLFKLYNCSSVYVGLTNKMQSRFGKK